MCRMQGTVSDYEIVEFYHVLCPGDAGFRGTEKISRKGGGLVKTL